MANKDNYKTGDGVISCAIGNRKEGKRKNGKRKKGKQEKRKRKKKRKPNLSRKKGKRKKGKLRSIATIQCIRTLVCDDAERL